MGKKYKYEQKGSQNQGSESQTRQEVRTRDQNARLDRKSEPGTRKPD